MTTALTVKTYTATDVKEIAFEDIAKTYRGDVGCACGCGGDYMDPANDEDAANILKHFKYINRGIKTNNDGLEFFGCGVEVSNPSYTQVTRIYFKDGINYEQYSNGRIERRVTVEAN